VGDRQTHRQTGDLISLLSFLESWIKTQRTEYLTCVKCSTTKQIKQKYNQNYLELVVGRQGKEDVYRYRNTNF
jgi:hypothetical protein